MLAALLFAVFPACLVSAPRLLQIFNPGFEKRPLQPAALYVSHITLVFAVFGYLPLWLFEQVDELNDVFRDWESGFMAFLAFLTAGWIGARMIISFFRKKRLRFGPSLSDGLLATVGAYGFAIAHTLDIGYDSGSSEGALSILFCLVHGTLLIEVVARRNLPRPEGISSFGAPPQATPVSLQSSKAEANEATTTFLDVCGLTSRDLLPTRRSLGFRSSVVLAVAGILLGLALVKSGFFLHRLAGSQALEFSLAFVLLLHLCSGSVLVVAAAALGTRSAARWRDDRRLDEFRLTRLRPLTICQLMLRPVIFRGAVFLAPTLVMLPFALYLPLAKTLPETLPHCLTTSLFVVKGFMSLVTGAWAGAAFGLLHSRSSAAKSQSVLAFLMLLSDAAIFLMFVMIVILAADLFSIDDATLTLLVSVGVLFHISQFGALVWLAKAYARQIEHRLKDGV